MCHVWGSERLRKVRGLGQGWSILNNLEDIWKQEKQICIHITYMYLLPKLNFKSSKSTLKIWQLAKYNGFSWGKAIVLAHKTNCSHTDLRIIYCHYYSLQFCWKFQQRKPYSACTYVENWLFFRGLKRVMKESYSSLYHRHCSPFLLND